MPNALRRRRICSLALPLVVAALGFAPSGRAQFVYNSGTGTMTGGSDFLSFNNFASIQRYVQNGGYVTLGPIPGDTVAAVTSLGGPVFYTLNSGTLNSGGFVELGGMPNGGTNPSFIVQNGGAATFGTLDIGVAGSAYVLTGGTLNTNIRFRGFSNNFGNFQLAGGILTAADIARNPGSVNNYGYFMFNGGTLRAGARGGDETWIKDGNTLVVSNGGAKIDTAGYNRTISSVLQHDAGGAAIDGGLTKLGEGTLTLNRALEYTGATTVEAGTLLLNRSDFPALTGTGSLIVNGGTFALGTSDETVGSFSGAGGTINLNSWTLNVIQSNTGTYAGNMVGVNGGFVKRGTGTLVLSGSNTHTGGTAVTAGKLHFAKASSLATGGYFSVYSGATGGFNIGGDGEFTWSQVGSLLGSSFQSGSFLALDTTNATGGSYTISQGLTNPIGLVKQGGGTLVLSGTNTYTGGTTVTGGTLQFAKTSSLFGALTVNAGATGAFNVGGVGEFSWAGINARLSSFQNGSWVGLDTTNAGGSFTVSNAIAGGFGLSKLGTGTLVLSGSNSFTGGVRVNGGVMEFADINSLGAVSGTVALNGGTLRWGTGNTSDVSSRINLGAAGGTIDTNGNTVTFANALSGTGVLTKTGAGLLRLTSANSHLGDTTVNGGVIVLAGPTSTRGQLGGLDGSKITINSGNINLESNNAVVGTNPHANILLTINTGGLLSTVNNVTILPEVVLDGGYIETASGGNSVTGNYTFTDGLSTAGTGKTSYIMGGYVVMPTAMTVGTGDTLRLGAGIIGNNNFVKHGAGTLVLTGSSTYNGSTSLNGGVIDFNNASAFGNAAGSITVNSSTLRWTGNTADLSSRLTLGSGGGTFDTNGNTVVFSSAIAGTGALIKTGAGTLQLLASAAHGGDTTVNGGVLQLTGASSTRGQLGNVDGSTITINSGNINLDTNNALVGTNPYANILLTINSGGLLSTDNSSTLLPEVLLDGGVIHTAGGGNFSTGNYIFTDGIRTAGTGTLSRIQGGAVALPTAVNVNINDTLRISSVIIGNNSLVKEGRGVLALTATNTFTGNIVVNGGLVEFGNASAFGNAANKITFDEGGLRWAAGNTLDISNRLNPIGFGGAIFDTNGNNVTFATALSGTGSLTKNGAGTLRLTTANAGLDGVIVNGGTLAAAHNNAVGNSVVFANGGTFLVEDNVAFSNEVYFGGGTFSRVMTGDLAGAVNAVSNLAGGKYGTASLLAGNLSTSSTLVISMSITSSALNDELRKIDVFHFAGTGTSTFVLEMTGGVLNSNNMLGWLDDDGVWVNAVDGNTGNTAIAGMQGFDGSYDEFLVAYNGYSLSQTIGAYGYDYINGAAWAVLNHNSEFAIIPEPGTATLLMLGGLTLLARRRQRKQTHTSKVGPPPRHVRL